MAPIKYEIVPSAAGWCVSCRDVVGPPYAQQADAIRDTLFIADLLRGAGNKVDVHVLELDGPHRVWRSPE